jgi:Beta-lactamase superfamily domain
MELQFYGANCVKLTTKRATIVIDDNLKSLGGKSVAKSDDIQLISSRLIQPSIAESRLVLTAPGEYEVSGVSIQGIAARSHIGEDENNKDAVIFKLIASDIKLVSLSHIYPELTDDQIEQLGTVDVLLVPVGGNGYTLDGIGALKVIKKIGPKMVIPTHFSDSSLKFEVPQTDLEEALKSLALEMPETVPKLKLKSGEFADGLNLTVLEKQ